MDFLKKFFGGKKDGGGHEGAGHSGGGDGFTCVNCGEKRDVSQKKAAQAGGERQKDGEVCEFC